MSQWAGGVLTAAGRALQAKVEAGTTALVLTKIKLGDGTESMDAVDNLTNLVGPKAVLGISSALADGDHATITGVVLSSQLQAGFWCREWGLFATDPDAGEILYMITIDNQPEWIPASTAAAQVSATYAMNVAVANATNITVAIDPAGLVDVEMLENFVGVPGRSKAIALGTTGMLENLPAAWYLECTTAGTTGATTPVITSPTIGGTVNDGTVVWTVRKSASTQDLTQYLPLVGGAMTGEIIKRNRDDQSLAVSGGNTAGAIILLGGKDYENGALHLYAGNGTGQSHIFQTSDGGLYFITDNINNKNVLHDLAGTAIVSSSMDINGYIKNAKGLIMQWGRVAASSFDASGVGYEKTISLPISFTQTAPITAFANFSRNGAGGEAAHVWAYCDQSQITLASMSNSSYNVNWFAIGY